MDAVTAAAWQYPLKLKCVVETLPATNLRVAGLFSKALRVDAMDLVGKAAQLESAYYKPDSFPRAADVKSGYYRPLSGAWYRSQLPPRLCTFN